MPGTLPPAELSAEEYSPFHAAYLAKVPPGKIVEILEQQAICLRQAWQPIDGGQSLERHPPYTWSLREVVGHLGDSERVFGYRALRISRGDTTELAGFDENEFVRQAEFDRKPWSDLLEEFFTLRHANCLMFRNLPPEAWLRRGIANRSPVSVRALAHILAGHAAHHAEIIEKRIRR